MQHIKLIYGTLAGCSALYKTVVAGFTTQVKHTQTYTNKHDHFFLWLITLQVHPCCCKCQNFILLLRLNSIPLYIYIPHLFKKIFIYLFGCARSQLQHMGSSLWHVGSFLVAACRLLSCSMWDLLVVACGLFFFSCGLWDLVSRPGIELKTPTFGAQSPDHWTTREVPIWHLHNPFICWWTLRLISYLGNCK